jgi:hypothetical protein
VREGAAGKAWATVALALAAIGVGAALAEGSVRLLLPESTGYFVFAPNDLVTATPLTELMPGVEGVAEFRTNSLGTRGDELGADGSEYRIGATTRTNVVQFKYLIPSLPRIYDDVHPTDLGSRAFAEVLANYLRRKPPYVSASTGP